MCFYVCVSSPLTVCLFVLLGLGRKEFSIQWCHCLPLSFFHSSLFACSFGYWWTLASAMYCTWHVIDRPPTCQVLPCPVCHPFHFIHSSSHPFNQPFSVSSIFLGIWLAEFHCVLGKLNFWTKEGQTCAGWLWRWGVSLLPFSLPVSAWLSVSLRFLCLLAFFCSLFHSVPATVCLYVFFLFSLAVKKWIKEERREQRRQLRIDKKSSGSTSNRRSKSQWRARPANWKGERVVFYS